MLCRFCENRLLSVLRPFSVTLSRLNRYHPSDTLHILGGLQSFWYSADSEKSSFVILCRMREFLLCDTLQIVRSPLLWYSADSENSSIVILCRLLEFLFRDTLQIVWIPPLWYFADYENFSSVILCRLCEFLLCDTLQLREFLLFDKLRDSIIAPICSTEDYVSPSV
jgi:hypothetical protein